MALQLDRAIPRHPPNLRKSQRRTIKVIRRRDLALASLAQRQPTPAMSAAMRFHRVEHNFPVRGTKLVQAVAERLPLWSPESKAYAKRLRRMMRRGQVLTVEQQYVLIRRAKYLAQ